MENEHLRAIRTKFPRKERELSFFNIPDSDPSNLYLDEDTIAIGIYCHGKIINSGFCTNMADISTYNGLSRLNKITLGEINTCTYGHPEKTSNVFRDISTKINDIDGKKKLINFYKVCHDSNMKFYSDVFTQKFAREVQKTIPNFFEKKYNGRSDFDLYSQHTLNQFNYNSFNRDTNVKNTQLLVKEYNTDHSWPGIRLLFDGKKHKTNLILNQSNYIKFPDNWRSIKLDETGNPIYSLDKNGNLAFTFNTIQLIQFLLSNGYSKILMYDVSCNVMDKANVSNNDFCSINH